MECAIIKIRADSGLEDIVHPVLLLFIGNEMLDGSNNTSALNAFDG